MVWYGMVWYGMARYGKYGYFGQRRQKAAIYHIFRSIIERKIHKYYFGNVAKVDL